MNFKNFAEYLDGRGKLVEKPKHEKVPDYSGPDPKKPNSAEVPKQLDKCNQPPKAAGSPAPYRPATSSKKGAKMEKGLGDKGDSKLAKHPGDEHPQTAGEGGKKIAGWKTTKTESFIEQTKNLSPTEFMSFMLQECGCSMNDSEDIPSVTAYTAGKFHPHPPEAIKYVATLALKNERIMDALIQEIKRQGGMDKLMEQLLDHPESYDGITSLMDDSEDGASRAKSLVSSMDDHYNKFMDSQSDMYESVGPPFGFHDEDDEDQRVPPQSEEGDEDHDDDEEGEPSPAANLDPKHTPDAEPGIGHHDDDAEEDEEGLDGGNDGDRKPRKLKKKFPHHHLIDAMKGVDHMRDAMQGSDGDDLE